MPSSSVAIPGLYSTGKFGMTKGEQTNVPEKFSMDVVVGCGTHKIFRGQEAYTLESNTQFTGQIRGLSLGRGKQKVGVGASDDVMMGSKRTYCEGDL